MCIFDVGNIFIFIQPYFFLFLNKRLQLHRIKRLRKLFHVYFYKSSDLGAQTSPILVIDVFLGRDHCNRHLKFLRWQRCRDPQAKLLLSGKQEHNLQMLITSLSYFGSTASPVPSWVPPHGRAAQIHLHGAMAFPGWHTDSRTSWKSCSFCATLHNGKPDKLEQAYFSPSLMDHVSQEPARNSEKNYTRAFKGEVFSFHWNPVSVFQG